MRIKLFLLDYNKRHERHGKGAQYYQIVKSNLLLRLQKLNTFNTFKIYKLIFWKLEIIWNIGFNKMCLISYILSIEPFNMFKLHFIAIRRCKPCDIMVYDSCVFTDHQYFIIDNFSITYTELIFPYFLISFR